MTERGMRWRLVYPGCLMLAGMVLDCPPLVLAAGGLALLAATLAWAMHANA